MGKGSNTSTTTQNNQPPAEFLAAYQDVLNQAKGVTSQPLQQYPGTPQSLIAGFSPDQLQAMDTVRGAQGIADPYINSAAQYMSQATAPLKTDDFLSYLKGATGPGVTDAATSGSQGILGAGASGQGLLSQAGQQGSQGILSASTSFTPDQIAQWQNPYTQQVVDATQAQFNNQNRQAQAGLMGNAASKGAIGGDRLGVAQAELANQQQLAQAPTIANLYSQGYGQGLGAAEQQAQLRTQGATSAGQLGAGMAQAGAQLGLGAAQGAGAMGLQGATTNAQLQSQAAQQAMAANQAQAWLNSQAGFGMGQLGQEALGTTMTGANALLGTGGMQQQFAQQNLNIPYEQFIQQQAYPFQTTGWLANIAEGLGSSSGGTGTSTSTSPGPSVGSQIAGLGLAGAGILGATGGFGKDGYLSGLFSGGGGGGGGVETGNFDTTAARGGAIRPHYALGGGMAFDTVKPPHGLDDVPNADITIVPNLANPAHGGMNILRNYGQTSTSAGSGGGNVLGDVASVVGIVKGIASLAALFNQGGRVGFAGGGVPVVTMTPSGHGGPDVPVLSRTGGGGGGSSSTGSGGSFNDYLNSVLGQIPKITPPSSTAANGNNATANNNPLADAVAAGVAQDKSVYGQDLSKSALAFNAGFPSFQDPRLVAGRLATAAQSGAPGASDAFFRYIGGGGFGGGAFGFGGGGSGGLGGQTSGGLGVGASHEHGTTEIDAGLAAENAAEHASQGGNGGGGGMGAGDVNGGMGGMYRRGGRLGGRQAFADGGAAGGDDVPVDADVNTLVERIQDAKDAMSMRSKSLLEPGPSVITNRPVGGVDPAKSLITNAPIAGGGATSPITHDRSATPPALGQPIGGGPGGMLSVDSATGPTSPNIGTPGSAIRAVGDFIARGGRYGGYKYGFPPPGTPITDQELAGASGPAGPENLYALSVGGGGQAGDTGAGPGDFPPGGASPPGDSTTPPMDRRDDLGAAPPPPPTRQVSTGPIGGGGGLGGGSSGATPPPEALAPPGDHTVAKGNGVTVTTGQGSGSKFPWEALIYAGLGIMGGHSKFPGVNIGQGGLEGAKLYEQQKLREEQMAQRRLQQQELNDYRRTQTGISQQRADQSGALGATRMRMLEYRMANPNATSAQLLSEATRDLQGRINPQTGAPYSASEAYRELHNLDLPWLRLGETARHNTATEGQGAQRIEQTQQRLLQSQAAQEAANALRAQGQSDANIRAVMSNATRRVAADLTGKLTLEQAVREEMKNWPGGPPSTQPRQPAAATAAPTGPEADLQRARQAIAGGAPRDAVIERLRAAGVDPAGL